MRQIFASLSAFVALASAAPAADRLDELFASWEKAQAGTQSLVVEYTVETKDGGADDEPFRATCIIRLLRKADGGICASYTPTMEQKDAAKRDRITYLLNNRSVYTLNHDKKLAFREDGIGDLTPYLERWFNPLLILLDRKRAEEKYAFEIAKSDEWYTCLLLKPKNPKTSGWFRDIRQSGVVFMNKETAQIPKDMPRQVIVWNSASRSQFDVKSWKMNGQDGPKPEEFTIPEERPGWEVFGSPLLTPTKPAAGRVQ
jgi:hypothetical protein